MRRVSVALLCAIILLTPACNVGPKYAKPTVPAPPSYKESPPVAFKETSGWKQGQPKDDTIRGKWWEIFGDVTLNELEEQIDPANQTLAQAEAQFRAARAAIRIARSGLYPTVTGGIAVSGSQISSNRSTSRGLLTSPAADLQIPFDVSYEVDLWGRIRNTIQANVTGAQASAADLQTLRLSLQAEMALDYFQLRGLDVEKQILDSTVLEYQRALDLTRNRHDQGIASGVDVAQAETQMQTTRAQATDTGVLRSQYEHAVAILTGKPPAGLTIAPVAASMQPPPIPVSLPAELLERRPDIAGAERRVAAANAEIGVAKAAYYPVLSFSLTAGLESANLFNLFSWPSHFWSLGPSMVQTIFDGGRRRAITAQAQALYDSTVASYRESVLAAFEDVEDNLAALRILEQEDREQSDAVKYSEQSLTLANNRYQGGVTTYLEVITAQNAELANKRTAVEILTRRMVASVLLIKALGGGWNASTLPSPHQLATK